MPKHPTPTNTELAIKLETLANGYPTPEGWNHTAATLRTAAARLRLLARIAGIVNHPNDPKRQ